MPGCAETCEHKSPDTRTRVRNCRSREKWGRRSSDSLDLRIWRPGSFAKVVRTSKPDSPSRKSLDKKIVGSLIEVTIEDKDRDDVMERLLELGGDKKYLTFDDLNRELPDNVVSPDDIEDVLQKLEGSNIAVADSDERLLEQAAA